MLETFDRTLSQFGKSAMALAELLEGNPHLDLIEQVFVENHIHILQSTYAAWKRRQNLKHDGRDKCTSAGK
jgi:hypothetical protein